MLKKLQRLQRLQNRRLDCPRNTLPSAPCEANDSDMALSGDSRHGFQVGNVMLGSYDELMVAEKFVSTHWHCRPSQSEGGSFTFSASTLNELTLLYCPPVSCSWESIAIAPPFSLHFISTALCKLVPSAARYYYRDNEGIPEALPVWPS